MIYAVYSENDYVSQAKRLKKVLKKYIDKDEISCDSDLYVLYLRFDKKILLTIKLYPTDKLLEESKGVTDKPFRIAEKYIFDILKENGFNVVKVHMKIENRVLFTINGLNALIYALTGKTRDEIDYNKIQINWEDYSYKFIHMTNNKLKIENTKLIGKFSFDNLEKELDEATTFVIEEEIKMEA